MYGSFGCKGTGWGAKKNDFVTKHSLREMALLGKELGLKRLCHVGTVEASVVMSNHPLVLKKEAISFSHPFLFGGDQTILSHKVQYIYPLHTEKLKNNSAPQNPQAKTTLPPTALWWQTDFQPGLSVSSGCSNAIPLQALVMRPNHHPTYSMPTLNPKQKPRNEASEILSMDLWTSRFC